MGNFARAVSLLALLLLPLSCAGPQEESGAVRSNSDGPNFPTALVARRIPGEAPVEIRQEEFAQALRMLAPQLTRVAMNPDLARRRLLSAVEAPPELEGLLLDASMEGRVVLASADLSEAKQGEMVQQYFQHCREIHGAWGDCLGVMGNQRLLTKEARRRLACHFAMTTVLEGMKDELRGMVDPQRIEAAILVGMVTWVTLVVLPEPFSKVLAVGLTIAMTAWLGVDALENVIGGWRDMVALADGATSLAELRDAGRSYGQRMGAQTIRIVVMLVAALISRGGLANLPALPKFNLASGRLAMATGGPGLEMVPVAQAATVTSSKITVVLAKAVQVGVAALMGGGIEKRAVCREEEHHIGTVENAKATWNGGPWTPRLKVLFDKVGLSMDSKYNRVKVFGHVGPHPPEYHQIVFDRLRTVFSRCSAYQECRAEFIRELERLGAEIATPGSALNDLVTRGCGKRP
jgi:hypothetical protein